MKSSSLAMLARRWSFFSAVRVRKTETETETTAGLGFSLSLLLSLSQTLSDLSWHSPLLPEATTIFRRVVIACSWVASCDCGALRKELRRAEVSRLAIWNEKTAGSAETDRKTSENA